MAELTDDVIDTIIAEAVGDGKAGMTAVAWAINNRAAKGDKSPDAVVKAPRQFDGYSNPGSGVRSAQRDPAIRAQVRDIWKGIQDRSIPDPLQGGTMFHAANSSPYWASAENKHGTVRIGNQTYYKGGSPLPPGDLPSVGTLTDTVPSRPGTPATIPPSMAALRSMTSPSGGDTALQQALAQYATQQANQATPAIRRPTLPPMGTPDGGSLYAGIYPQVRTNAPQSTIERSAARIPLVRGNLTDPGAIDASVSGISQSPALQAALTRAISRPTPAPQSQIERTALPIGQSQIERTALPRNVPPDLIAQSMQRIASANPVKLPPIAPSTIGQPPSTRSVQSVAMPALGSAASRTPPRVTVSTPNTVPQRMAAQDIGNVPRALPQANPFVPEQRYIEPRNVAPVAPYQGPFVPNKGLERLETPTALSFNPIQQPPAFTTQMRPVQVPNPAWSATPAIPAAGTPMSGGLSRDAVALRAKGLAAAQAMANVPKFITVQQPVRVPARIPAPVQSPAYSPLRIAVNGAQMAPARVAMTPVQALQARGLTAAQAYDQLNAGNGGPRTAADRPGKSLSQSGGQKGMTEGFW